MEFFEDSNLEPPPDFVDEFEDTYAPLEEEVDYDYEEFYNSQDSDLVEKIKIDIQLHVIKLSIVIIKGHG